jgi:hypothetical protein
MSEERVLNQIIPVNSAAGGWVIENSRGICSILDEDIAYYYAA